MTFRIPAVVLALLLLFAAPASAVGTGGVDISPYPGVVNGTQVTAFHTKVPSRGTTKVQYSLRNTTAKPASARLFSASALRTSGTFTIGTAGSSPYLDFPDRTVVLQPNETRIESFDVHPGPDGRPSGKVYGAIVVEVKNGSIVQQAAVVVYLERGRTVPIPLLLMVAAVAVLSLAALGFLVTLRRRSSP